MRISKPLLRIAGALSLAVAIFQAVISFFPSWSLYFGAPAELVSNPPLLYGVGLAVAVVFAVFGLYAFSGAGDLRPLPLLRLGLLGIGAIYTLRGLFIIPLLLILGGVIQTTEIIPPQGLNSTLVSLFIGIIYLAGTLTGWRQISSESKDR